MISRKKYQIFGSNIVKYNADSNSSADTFSFKYLGQGTSSCETSSLSFLESAVVTLLPLLARLPLSTSDLLLDLFENPFKTLESTELAGIYLVNEEADQAGSRAEGEDNSDDFYFSRETPSIEPLAFNLGEEGNNAPSQSDVDSSQLDDEIKFRCSGEGNQACDNYADYADYYKSYLEPIKNNKKTWSDSSSLDITFFSASTGNSEAEKMIILRAKKF
jgi:hypothetical protein